MSSIGSLGLISSAFGSYGAQGKGSEVDRARQESSTQAGANDLLQKAEGAAGIGEMEQDSQASDRDADGRRVLEIGPRKKRPPNPDDDSTGPPRSKDRSPDSGNHLDLTG